VLHCNRLEMLVRYKRSSLLDPFVNYEKIKCCEYALNLRWKNLRMTILLNYHILINFYRSKQFIIHALVLRMMLWFGITLP
jgi:hypothetical protein